MNKDSKFTAVIDILGVIAFWIIAIGTMWSVYYTRLVYLQNKQAIEISSVTAPTSNTEILPSMPDDGSDGGTYMIPSPPDYQNPFDNPPPSDYSDPSQGYDL